MRKRNKHQSFDSRVKQLEHSLAGVIRQAYREMFGAVEEHARPFSLEVRLDVEPGRPWRLSGVPPLEEQIRSAVQDMATRADAYQPGRVYCYRCDSAVCAHSLPPLPGSVFGGYSSTGQPEWPELAQVLLEISHPRVDLLFQPSQKDIVAAFIPPEMLKQRQLNVFGKESKTYDILGQVVFGFVLLRSPSTMSSERERVAFTAQAVESRWLNGNPRLELNLLGRLSDGSHAADAFSGPYQARLTDIIATTQHRVSSLAPYSNLSRRKKPARVAADVPKQVEVHLKKLAGAMEKAGRQRGRRTDHAESRRESNRPTSKAREDALSATGDLTLWDRYRRTVVVVGARNRVHVFSPEGKHITSFSETSEGVQSRLRRGRWRPLRPETRETFRAAVASLPEEEGED